MESYTQEIMTRYIDKLVEEHQLDKQVLEQYWSDIKGAVTQVIVSEKQTCQSVVKTGTAAGKMCGREMVKGLCPIHKPRGKRSAESPAPSVTEAVVNSDGEEEVVLPKKDKKSAPCKYMFTKGKKSKETCGKKCVEGSEFCKNHGKPVEKSDTSRTSVKEAEEEEVMEIRCQRKGQFIVLKGTMVALSDDIESCLGYLEPQENGEFVLVETYTEEVAQVCSKYKMKCVFSPSKMVIEDE
jgi:hypothetical protein